MWVSRQFRAPFMLLLDERAPFTHAVGGWIVPRAILNTGEDTNLLTWLGISQNSCDDQPIV